MHRDAWFTRGWTLQELLAPRSMVFYNRQWSLLTQNDRQLFLKVKRPGKTIRFAIKTFPKDAQLQIFEATSIGSDELKMCFLNLEQLPISRVFQLACRRNITREEDRVYSLMGLLGTSISVAYGEGLPAAFKRLIREVMVTKNRFLDVFNHSDTHQLIPDGIMNYHNRSPVFDRASSHQSTSLHQYQSTESISMTHLGVYIPILLVPAFLKETYEQRIPSGAQPHSISISFQWHLPHTAPTEYLLLKNNSTSANFIDNQSVVKLTYTANPGHKVIFCGILNFWMNGTSHRTSEEWLYVPLSFRSLLGDSKITDIDTRNLEQLSGPQVLSWPKSGYEYIREEDLQKMGMTVTTLYLK